MTTPVSFRRPARAAWLAVGIPLTLAALFFGGVNVLSVLASQSQTEQRTVQVGSAAQLDVRLGSGDVVLLPGTDGQVTIRSHATWAYRKPHVAVDVDGRRLELRSGCAPWWQFRCDVDFTVWVPPGMAVDASSGSGDVTVRNLAADLRLNTGSGDISLDGGRGSLLARTGSGEITGTRLDADSADVHTGSGDASLDFARAPHHVRAKAGSGEVDITVPGHDRYRVSVDTGSGDEDVSVVQDPAATRVIQAETGSGDVTVGYQD